MTYTTSASGDLVSTYTYSDLQDTTWDDGGYVNVTIINEAQDILVLTTSSDTISGIVEGFGDTYIDLETIQIKWYVEPFSIVEGYGVLIENEGSGLIVLASSDVTVHASSNISVAVTDITISSDDVFISLSPTMLPEEVLLNVTLNEPLIITNSLLSISNINLDIIVNTPIIPTWRWPYVGCKEEVANILEELVVLKLKEDTYSVPFTEETFSLSIDC